MVGGMVVLAVGGAAYGAVKLSQKDSDRIEEQTVDLTDEDKAALAAEGGQAPASTAAAQPAPEESYLEELERLADLRDRGVISEADFEAKKQQLLGL